jgi:hypothetical protein
VPATTGASPFNWCANLQTSVFHNKDNALWPALAVTTSLQLGVEMDALLSPRSGAT